MLHIINSNRQEVLLDALQKRLLKKRDISEFRFNKEIVLAQNVGMQRWLTLEIAKKHKISAGIEFDFPLRFIWNLFKDICHFEGKELIASRKEYVQTRLFDLIQKKQGNETIKQYLDSTTITDNQLKLWDLSAKLASLFDEYELFRTEELPTKIQKLSQEKDWQYELYQELISSKGDLLFRHESQMQVIDKLRTKSNYLNFTELHIYTIPTLPEATLKTLLLISEQPNVDVFWYHLKPTTYNYWSELNPSKIPNHIPKMLDFLETTGTEGREQASLIGKIINDEKIEFMAENLFVGKETNPKSHLEALQKVLLTNEPNQVQNSDDSIQIHSNYSAQREVEVLRDYLLKAFAENPEMSPGDVLVMSSNIDVYAPHIEYYFNEELHDAQIPYSIADTKFSLENELVQALIQLFEIVQSNLKRTELLDFLHRESVKKKWDFDESVLSRYTSWIIQTNTLQGWDIVDYEPDWGTFDFNKFRDTLYKSLFYLTDENQLIDEKLIPFTMLTQDEIESWGKIEQFLSLLFHYQTKISEPKTVTEWLSFSLKLINHFIDEGDKSQLTQKLVNIQSAVEKANAKTPITAEHFLRFFNLYVDDSSAGSGFLQGKVTCCAMVPLRSLPFKYICLLGLNEGQFPGKKIRSSFDWLEQEPKPGDRDRKKDDEYLFLESILSARKQLYLSYVGRSIKDDSKLPKSALVQQFIDLVSKQTGHQPKEFEHTLYAHNPVNFTDKNTSLNTRAFEVLKHSYQNEEIRPVSEIHLNKENIRQDWDLQEWLKFVENPPLFILNKDLGIPSYRLKDELSNNEIFERDGLENWKFKEMIFNLLLENPQITDNEIYLLIRENGLLNAGFNTKKDLFDDISTIRDRLEWLKKEIWINGIPPINEVLFKNNPLSISGNLRYDNSDVYVYHTFSSIKVKHKLKAYLTGCLLAQIYQKKIQLTILEKEQMYKGITCEVDSSVFQKWIQLTENRFKNIPLFHHELSGELKKALKKDSLIFESILDYEPIYNQTNLGVELGLTQLGKKTNWELSSNWIEFSNLVSDIQDLGKWEKI